MKFNEDGQREISCKLTRAQINNLKSSWVDHLNSIRPIDISCQGKGIVMCAGGVTYFTCCWVALKALRRTGCKLPVELWYNGNELPDFVIRELSKENVICKDFMSLSIDFNIQSGVMLKPLSILKSSFKEVLFLDVDNVCVLDPTYLFYLPEYKNTGALFWPDYWETTRDNPIWRIIDKAYMKTKEQESGQMLINKEECWKELSLCLYFNRNNNIYYQFLLGDKDTFRFSWMALNRKYFMIKKNVATCGYINDEGSFFGTTMVQYNTNNEIQFLHRNLLKWDVTQKKEKIWKVIKDFMPKAKNRKYIFGVNETYRHYFIDFNGDIEISNVSNHIKNLEDFCMAALEDLRKSVVYKEFLLYAHSVGNRYLSETRISFNV